MIFEFFTPVQVCFWYYYCTMMRSSHSGTLSADKDDPEVQRKRMEQEILKELVSIRVLAISVHGTELLTSVKFRYCGSIEK